MVAIGREIFVLVHAWVSIDIIVMGFVRRQTSFPSSSKWFRSLAFPFLREDEVIRSKSRLFDGPSRLLGRVLARFSSIRSSEAVDEFDELVMARVSGAR